MFRDASLMFRDASLMFMDASLMFHVPCSMFHVPCSMFRVPCSMFQLDVDVTGKLRPPTSNIGMADAEGKYIHVCRGHQTLEGQEIPDKI